MKATGKIASLFTLTVLILGLWPPAFANALRNLDLQLMEAAREGNAVKVKSMIGKGANVNARDEAGNTALHFATKKDIASLLISAGALVNEKNDDFEMTPLFNVPTDIAAFLIVKGAAVNMRARKGMTPLSWAVYWDQEDKVELLISKGANVNEKDDDGKAALHVAANGDKKEFVSLLIAKGANINAKDNDGWTPLHWAVFEATVDTIELLLTAGADRNAISYRSDDPPGPGETPLDVAKKFRSPDMVAYLISKGCRSAAP